VGERRRLRGRRLRLRGRRRKGGGDELELRRRKKRTTDLQKMRPPVPVKRTARNINTGPAAPVSQSANLGGRARERNQHGGEEKEERVTRLTSPSP